VQLEKLLYLAEAHVGIDLQGDYQREAAGPLDPDIYKLESLAKKQKWFTAKKRSARINAFYYLPGPAMAERVSVGRRILGEKEVEFDSLLRIFRKTDTEQAEIIATLYGAWNDLLLDGKTPTDDEIIVEVRDRWHEKKRRFDPDRLRAALRWMRQKDLTPRGIGPRTRNAISELAAT
jgi:type I restriction enzyme S subunit